MKNNLMIFFCLAFCAHSMYAQTEVYRFSDNSIWRLLEDGKGNVYTVHGTGNPIYFVDKIGPDGTLLWSREVAWPWFPNIAIGGSGVYITRSTSIDPPDVLPDTVSYIDSLGATVWTRQFSVSSNDMNFMVADKDGNLIIQFDSSLVRKMMKIRTSGVVAFDVPLRNLPSPSVWSLAGLFINTDGNIWMPFESTSGDAVLIDGNTGKSLKRIHLFASNGRSGWYPNTLGDATAYQISGRNLVYGGTWSEIVYGKGNREEYSQWRVVIAQPHGSVIRFNYKGNGLASYSEKGVKVKSDFLGNNLLNIATGGNNAIYLHGTAARSTAKRGVGSPSQLHDDDVVLCYDASREKVAWTVVTPDTELDFFCFYAPAQELLIGPSVTSTLQPYGSDGVKSSTPLTFSDIVCLFNPILQNTENGYIYLRMWHDASGDQYYYIAKYSLGTLLADQWHSRPPALENSVLPGEYSLFQNYPNPFNPTTTISFGLARHALVTIGVYNVLGQEIATLVSRKEYGQGTNELVFDGSNLPSGAYYYRITTEDMEGKGVVYSNVKKMLLLK